jgi:hypothetical protein
MVATKRTTETAVVTLTKAAWARQHKPIRDNTTKTTTKKKSNKVVDLNSGGSLCQLAVRREGEGALGGGGCHELTILCGPRAK